VPDKADRVLGPRYKWIALSNTTIGISLATINNSILLISLPASGLRGSKYVYGEDP
jgi:hypothetical protein